MHSRQELSITVIVASLGMLSVFHSARPQATNASESLVPAGNRTCSDAKKHEQDFNAEINQQPNTPLLTAKRGYRGDPAHVIYFCGANDRIVRRQIFMRFSDPSSAEAAFNRHTSALIEELGQPCVAVEDATPESDEEPAGGDDQPSSSTRRTVIWNINVDYNALLFFYPGTSSSPWQVQLIFNSLAETKLSDASQNIWRAHGCNVPTQKEHDPNSPAMTLILP